MTFNAPSFFAGIGTVLGLVVLGFGGGVLMSDVIFDHGARAPSKIERQTAEPAKPVAPPNPVPVIEAQSAPAPVPVAQPVQALTPVAEPQPSAPAQPPPAPQPQTMLAAPATAPPLGPQKPVSLANPAHEKVARDEARQKKDEAKRAAREKKKAEQRRLAEQRHQQQMKEAELKAAADRSKGDDLDDEQPDDRPLLRPERDDFFRAPRSRLFGNDW